MGCLNDFLISSSCHWILGEGEYFKVKEHNGKVSFTIWNNYKGAVTLGWNFSFKISCKMGEVIAHDIRSLYVMAWIMWKNMNVNSESQFGEQACLTGKVKSHFKPAREAQLCILQTIWAWLIFWSFGFEKIKSLFMCGWADDYWDGSHCLGRGIRKRVRKWNVKWSVISCHGRNVGTRCYLYVGNGLSQVRAQITDLLFFSSSLTYYYWSFHYLVYTLSPQWHSSFSSARCMATKQLISRHLIYPLTPILIGPYHHKHITEFQQWLSGY